MRTRLLGFSAAVVVAVLALLGPAAQAATPGPGVDAQTCVSGGGSVEYDSATGQWTCVGGTYNTTPIKQ